MVSPSICATLRFTAQRAENLKDLQLVLAQDPFVRITLLPWGEEAETKAASGVNPTWKAKHHNVLDLHYPGRPVPPAKAEVLVEVYDAEVTRAARLIGETTVVLTDWLRRAKLDEAQDMALEIKDPKGKPAGTVFLSFQVVLTGTLEVTALRAYNLKNVQRFLEQDPYVKASLLPGPDNGKPQEQATKPSSGINPEWTKRHKNKLTFTYDGEPSPRLLVEVFDKEWVQADRHLGTGGVDLVKKLLSKLKGGETAVTSTVELVDELFTPAGRVDLELRFFNDAYDESKPVVRGVSSKDLTQSMQGGDFFHELARAFFHMEGSLEAWAPEFMHELTGPLSGIPVSALVAAFWMLSAVAGLVVLLTRGAKLLSLLVGVLPPCYSSFKAIESDEKEDDTQMLTYWTLFGFSMILEETLLKPFALLQPGLFFLLKMAFLVWLSHPSLKGATILYQRVAAPLLRRYEARIDQNIKRAHKAVGDANRKIRVEPKKGKGGQVEAAGDEADEDN